MRILYDTNVLIAMLSRRESILKFKNQLESDAVHISSPFILAEVEAVLVKKLKITKQKAKATVRLLERQSVIVEPKKMEKICRDPFDDYVLAAAVSGSADYLVTADKDLLVLEKYKRVVMVVINTSPFNPKNNIGIDIAKPKVRYDHEQFKKLTAHL